MSENTQNDTAANAQDPAAGEAQQTAPAVHLRQVFTDNLSVEVPNTPQVFIDQPHFEVNVSIHPDFDVMSIENHFVARLRITLTAQSEDKTVYVVETRQCGVFEIVGFDQAQVHHLLHVYCPITLFPYAREALSSALLRTGFPPVLLPQFDFETLYRERIESMRAQMENEEKAAANGQAAE